MMTTSKIPFSQKFFPASATRDRVRHAMLSVLAVLSKESTKKALRVNRVQNLYFHFLPDDAVDNFRKLIRVLAEDHQFISYSEAVERVKTGRIDKPYLSISFDDGFESNLRAAELLYQEGISACFFVCPEMLGKDREALEHEFSGDLGDEKRMMTWEEVEHLISLGHEIGSHTLDHSVLSALSLDEAKEQIVRSKQLLDVKLPNVVHFAWPRGQFHHFRPELVSTVFSSGYDSCTSAVRGAHMTKLPKAGNIRRENCVASWPVSHTLYLLGLSIRRFSTKAGDWPPEWRNKI